MSRILNFFLSFIQTCIFLLAKGTKKLNQIYPIRNWTSPQRTANGSMPGSPHIFFCNINAFHSTYFLPSTFLPWTLLACWSVLIFFRKYVSIKICARIAPRIAIPLKGKSKSAENEQKNDKFKTIIFCGENKKPLAKGWPGKPYYERTPPKDIELKSDNKLYILVMYINKDKSCSIPNKRYHCLDPNSIAWCFDPKMDPAFMSAAFAAENKTLLKCVVGPSQDCMTSSTFIIVTVQS